MSSHKVNGEVPNSLFFQHIFSYPAVAEGIEYIKSTHYGATSLQYAEQAQHTFVDPILPYAAKPYAYISPYVNYVDDLGNRTLNAVDHRVPIITKDTTTIKNTLQEYREYPGKKAGEGWQHVQGTWGTEYKKCGGDGYVAQGKATVCTGLIVTSEVLGVASDWLSTKKVEGEHALKEHKHKAEKVVKEKTHQHHH